MIAWIRRAWRAYIKSVRTPMTEQDREDMRQW